MRIGWTDKEREKLIIAKWREKVKWAKWREREKAKGQNVERERK